MAYSNIAKHREMRKNRPEQTHNLKVVGSNPTPATSEIIIPLKIDILLINELYANLFSQ